ncbi:MAG: hypothetical protein WA081_10815 [Desulfosalsimonadaceae bacterium]
MQQEQNPLYWFMHMVQTGAINPSNPDMSLVPDNIMSQILWEEWPDGEILPTQAAVNVSYFLFLSSKIAIQIRHGNGLPRHVTTAKRELFIALEKILILAGLEILKRDGVLKYHIRGLWHDQNAGILIFDLNPHLEGPARSHMFCKFFSFN